MQKYNKFIVAAVAALVSGLTAYFGTDAEVVQVVVAIAAALGVYAVENR